MSENQTAMIKREEKEIIVQSRSWNKVKREIIILVWKYQLGDSCGTQRNYR